MAYLLWYYLIVMGGGVSRRSILLTNEIGRGLDYDIVKERSLSADAIF